MKQIKKFFRRGNGELLGFAIIMPMFIFLMTFIVAIAQVALAKEKMEYVAYSCGRAAVVAENAEQGIANAEDIIRNSDQQYHASVKFIINNQEITSSNVHTLTGIPWHKGQNMTVVVTYSIPVISNPVMGVLGGQHENKIVMMIERPAQ